MIHKYFALSILLIVTGVVRCKPDYLFNNLAGGWLKLHTIPATWQEAFLRCQYEGAVLASPLDKQLADALHTLLTQSDMHGRIFLGTHDLFSKGDFVSVEGVPLSDMQITWGLNDIRLGDADCLTMTAGGITNLVYFSSCTVSLPYICYRKLDNQTMNECGTFDDEYHLSKYTGSCYKVHQEKQTWSSAYRICVSEGGYLVILNDREEARIVKDMFPVRDEVNLWEQFHIGLLAWGDDRSWTTIHGERLKDVFHDWHPGQPDNHNGYQDHATLIRAGTLDDGNPSTRAMFVCEKSPDSIRFEASPLAIDERFPTNLTKQIWLKNMKMENWRGLDGAVLASPLDKQLADALHTLLTQSDMHGRIFLGTHDLFSKGDFASVEGVPLSDMQITWGLNDIRPGDADCLTMTAGGITNLVYFSSCTVSLPYICYRKLDNQTMNECGTFDDEYHLSKYTGSCYKVHQEKQTWSSAYRICVSEGGYLVILNDREEARIVKDMFPVRDEVNLWEQFHIGLLAWGDDRSWTTIHGERLKDVFHDWHPGQPDNHNGYQDHATLIRAGTLDDGNPSTRAMYVCEKSPDSIRFEDSPLAIDERYK